MNYLRMINIKSDEVPDMLLDENLGEFFSKISFIVSLEKGGKLTPIEAYNKIKNLFKTLKKSKKGLFENGKNENQGSNLGDNSNL